MSSFLSMCSGSSAGSDGCSPFVHSAGPCGCEPQATCRGRSPCTRVQDSKRARGQEGTSLFGRLNIQVSSPCSDRASPGRLPVPRSDFPRHSDPLRVPRSCLCPVPAPSVGREQTRRVSTSAPGQSWISGIMPVPQSLPGPLLLRNNHIITVVSPGT